MLLGILLCVGDKQIAVDILDAERREAGGERGISEAAVAGYKLVVVIEDVDRPGVEVGGEEKYAIRICAEHQTLVHRTRGRIIGGEHRGVRRGQAASPGGKRAVFGCENERGGDWR